MQPLTRNEDTGFLESKRSYGSDKKGIFDSNAKVLFLDMAQKYIDEREWPPIHELCRAIRITTRTFEQHLHWDPEFNEQWKEKKRQLQYLFTQELAIKAKGKMGTLANLALLRNLETGSWVVNNVSQSDSNSSHHKSVLGAIDAEIIEETPQIEGK